MGSIEKLRASKQEEEILVDFVTGSLIGGRN